MQAVRGAGGKEAPGVEDAQVGDGAAGAEAGGREGVRAIGRATVGNAAVDHAHGAVAAAAERDGGRQPVNGEHVGVRGGEVVRRRRRVAAAQGVDAADPQLGAAGERVDRAGARGREAHGGDGLDAAVFGQGGPAHHGWPGVSCLRGPLTMTRARAGGRKRTRTMERSAVGVGVVSVFAGKLELGGGDARTESRRTVQSISHGRE